MYLSKYLYVLSDITGVHDNQVTSDLDRLKACMFNNQSHSRGGTFVMLCNCSFPFEPIIDISELTKSEISFDKNLFKEHI